MVEPLFKSEGSVYRRRVPLATTQPTHVGNDDDDDEDWVDRSIPFTPVHEHFEDPLEAGPSSSYSRARSSTPLATASSVKREQSPTFESTIKDEVLEDRGDRDDTPPLREIDSDDLEELDAPPEDERQCRICFAGKEEEGTMGRLISPCLCTGSVRYVHVSCINAWRGSGSNAKAFIECQQCHYHYHFRRTLISGLATSRPIILLSTFLLFASLTLFAGQVMTWLLSIPAFHNRVLDTPSSSSKYVFLGDDDEWYELDDSAVIYVSGGGTLMWDIVVGAVRTFATVANRLSHSKGEGGLWGMMPSAAQWLALRSLMGLAVLGSFSFLSLLLSLSLFGPLQLANGLRGAGLLGNWSRRRRGTGTGVGQYMMIAIVVIGSINTLISVYGTVEILTQRILKYVETQILEVNPEDRRKAREEREEVWWRRWIRERRYRSRNGWEEVWARLLIRIRVELRGMKRRWEVWKDSMVHGLEDHEVDERI